MAESDGRIVACKELLPFYPPSRPVDRRLVAEATLLEQMVRLDDGGPWSLAVAQWQKQLEVTRTRAMRPSTAEELRVLQMEARGYELATTLVQSLATLGMKAQERLNQPEAALPRMSGTPQDLGEASRWRTLAEHARKLVETAGWQVLTRRLAERAWTVVWLKTVCPPEVGPMLDALAKALVTPIHAIQTYIDCGYSAAAWFQKQETEAKE